MSNEPVSEIPLDRKLSEIFDEGYGILKQTLDAGTSQNEINKCMRAFEDATRLVSLVGMFSSNESIEEVPTENLRYLLLPYYLGRMSCQLQSQDRKEVVEVAEIYYKDFLKRCEQYGLFEKPDHDTDSLAQAVESAAIVPGAMSDKLRELNRMGYERQEKIRKYQEKKELEEKIKELSLVVENGSTEVDEDRKREYYSKLLRAAILEAQDELVSIEREKQMLAYIAGMPKRAENDEGQGPHDRAARKHPPTTRPLKPIIITRDAVQKAVYGRGYPSFPTMTVAEFYEQRVAEGIFPDAEKMKEVNKNSLMNRVYQDNAAELDKEQEEEEKLIERDDAEYLARQRAKDEFKDEHRRGEGNRYNRS
uniref:Putative immunoglobulin-binding protein 1 n=1 Tax=Anopheles braziliensis TaxID=58242 RepID=A0A2M3Z9C3_9DIPT